uniref:Glutamine amidotransferase domain-containing protein n=1 Tax=viral metagenome TaxID=1070528 RepID=A0A6C0K6L6_9ZZZZ
MPKASGMPQVSIVPKAASKASLVFLVINMYSTRALFKRFKKGYENALKGHKIIFKDWDDTEGIRDVLRKKSSVNSDSGVSGIIITGSNYFVKGRAHSTIDDSIMRSHLPILAICYGFQYMVCRLGSVRSLGKGYRKSFIKSNKDGYMKYHKSFRIASAPLSLLPSLSPTKYFFYHTDYIVKVPKTFEVIKKIKNKIVMAYNSKKNILGVQFHPEKYKKSARQFFNLWISNYITARK